MYIKSIFIVIAFTILSCGKDPGIPAFIYLKNANISGPANFGDMVPDIYGCKLEVASQNRGYWQFPSLVPVLFQDSQAVSIYPLVRVNNLSTNYESYPMLEPYFTNFFLVPKKVDTISVPFKYSESVKLLMTDGFEGGNPFGNSKIVSALGRNNTNALQIDVVSSMQESLIMAINSNEVICKPGSEIWLEFDYKMAKGALIPALSYSDANGKQIDLYAQNFLKPNANFTRVYWKFSELVGVANVTNLRLNFILLAEQGQKEATTLIDNIRLLQL